MYDFFLTSRPHPWNCCVCSSCAVFRVKTPLPRCSNPSFSTFESIQALISKYPQLLGPLPLNHSFHSHFKMSLQQSRTVGSYVLSTPSMNRIDTVSAMLSANISSVLHNICNPRKPNVTPESTIPNIKRLIYRI